MKALALPLGILLAFVVAAEERYVPVVAGTELQLTNPSARRTMTAKIELLGGISTEVEVGPGETVRWNVPADEGVLRVDGDVRLAAVSHRESSRTSLPVVDADSAVNEAEIPQRAPWRSGLLVINPGDATAVVTIDDAPHTIGPRGVLRVDGASVVRTETPLLVFASDRNEVTGARVFTPIAPNATTRKRRAVRSGPPSQVTTQTVVLTPSKDNTLYESSIGEFSNGKGVHLFVGRIRFGEKRRALLAFDVAGQIPPGSRITRVSLTMSISRSASSGPVTLHRVTQNWGEGTSNAGTPGGGGDGTTPGDATWIHASSPNTLWTTPGGDFDAAADASASVAQSGTWESVEMIARVQQWLDQPAANFGWLLRGGETSISAKRFDSREIATAAARPALTIEFQR